MPFTIVPVDYDALPDVYKAIFRDGMRRPYDVEEPSIETDGELHSGWVTMPSGERYYIVVSSGGFVVKRIEEPFYDTDPVIQRYGRYDASHTFFPEDRRLYHFLNREIVIDFPTITDLEEECFKSEIRPHERLLLHSPRRSSEYKGKISLFQSAINRDMDKRIAMKPGRAIKYMFPELPDSYIESLVDEFRKDFSEKTLNVTISGSWRDFKRAYSGKQADMENPSTTYSRKSLACSCMRYEFDHLSAHPAEAYASGDFKIIYTHDDDERIHSRCVVYMKHESGKPQAGPVYGVCEASIDRVEEELRNMKATFYSNSEWVGAKLKRLEHNGRDDQFIAPYLDVEPRLLKEYNSEYLMVDNYGNIDASTYSGVLTTGNIQCDNCGDYTHEDDTMYSEYLQERMCDDCFHDRHFYCDWISDYVNYDEGVTVYIMTRWGVDTETVSEQNRDDNYFLCSDGKYWHEDDVNWCEDEQEWISPNDMDQYFISDVDHELYHQDKMAESDLFMTVDQLKEMKEKEEKCTA